MDLISCPSIKQIKEFLSGEIHGQLAEKFTKHFKGCPSCQKVLADPGARREQISADLESAGAAMASPLSDDGSQTSLLSFLAPAVGSEELGWLGNYRVLKVLGEGGMGIVLLAEDTLLMRPVALKVMKLEISRSFPDARQRFLREARTMAQVRSEHVVTVHQVGETNGVCFIAMELLEGEPLDRFMEKESQPPLSEVLRIGREIALALSSAHSQGLIHRDIKPENIWLEAPAGRVKLLDFGLARPQLASDKLTVTGVILGSPSYMSPEQAQAFDIDERSDLFSLGCILYLMICGKEAFHGPTLISTLLAIVDSKPLAPADTRMDLPAGLDALIMRLLAKDPQERLQSASEVVEQIMEIEKRLHGTLVDTLATKAPDRGQTVVTTSGAMRLSGTRDHQDREAERRQVSVLGLTCSLFDSEEYFELDVEDQTKILKSFQNTCRETVMDAGGTLVQDNEEYLLVCFGYPTAYDEQTVVAARSAFAVIDSLASLSKQLLDEYGIQLGLRLGLHTGLAIVESKDKQISLVGEARKVALAVMGLASGGQIVCSDTARSLLKNRFDCIDLGRKRVKGMKQAISVFQIKAENDNLAGVDQSIPSMQLVGRDLEMSLLMDRWSLAEEGTGQVVLLGGEAGLGKSHIVQAIKDNVLANRKAGEESCLIEWYCSPHFRNTSLHPAISFFERLLHFERHEMQASKYERLLACLEQLGLTQPGLVPLFASLLNLGESERFPSLSLTPVREREELFRALKELLRAYCARQSILFIIEDLHWIDDSTLQFLDQFLAEGLNEQLLVLLTFRPEFRAPWTMQPQHTSISLSRLSRQQAGELVNKRAGRELPVPVVAQICERAGGVPLFIAEFTRMVQESGMLGKSGVDSGELRALVAQAIPATLQELIITRLDRLEGDLNLVQLAATLGPTFTYELLSDVSGLDENTLKEELSKLVHGEIIHEKGRPPKSTYLFRHVLFQDALYNALVKPKRRQFHERIAEALKVRQAKTGDVVSEILAHHLTEAGMIEQSIEHWLAAGLRSQEQCANVEAINHFTAGLELLKTLPQSAERDRQELSLLNPMGSAYQATLGYSAPIVGPLFSRARELCQKIGEPFQQFEVLWGNWTWHLVRGDLQLCMDLAGEMMLLASNTADSGMLMEAYVAPAVTLFYRGDFAGCFKHCKEAISQYENADRCRDWAAKLGQNSAVVIRCYQALALWHLGYPDRAQKLIDEMLSLARECQHPFSLGHALHFASWFYQYCRLGDKLLSSAEEQLALSAQQGFALWQATGTFLKGAGLVLLGRNEEGLHFMEKGMALFKATSAALTLSAQLGVLAEAYIGVGRFESARLMLNEGLRLADKHEDYYQAAELYRLNAALVLAENGRGATKLAAAERSFDKAIEIAGRQESRAWQLRSTISLVKLKQVQGRAKEGESILRTIYDTYTEGLSLPDLAEARELIRTLSLFQG